MIYAYDESLFSKAQLSLASMFEYAVNCCREPVEEFYFRFLASPVSGGFESGRYDILAGKSGIELAREVLGLGEDAPEPAYPIPRTGEFWLGWVLAHYQWVSDIPFRKITEDVSIQSIRDMYPKYHEMDITSFDEALDQMRLAKALNCDIVMLLER